MDSKILFLVGVLLILGTEGRPQDPFAPNPFQQSGDESNSDEQSFQPDPQTFGSDESQFKTQGFGEEQPSVPEQSQFKPQEFGEEQPSVPEQSQFEPQGFGEEQPFVPEQSQFEPQGFGEEQPFVPEQSQFEPFQGFGEEQPFVPEQSQFESFQGFGEEQPFVPGDSQNERFDELSDSESESESYEDFDVPSKRSADAEKSTDLVSEPHNAAAPFESQYHPFSSLPSAHQPSVYQSHDQSTNNRQPSNENDSPSFGSQSAVHPTNSFGSQVPSLPAPQHVKRSADTVTPDSIEPQQHSFSQYPVYQDAVRPGDEVSSDSVEPQNQPSYESISESDDSEPSDKSTNTEEPFNESGFSSFGNSASEQPSCSLRPISQFVPSQPLHEQYQQFADEPEPQESSFDTHNAENSPIGSDNYQFNSPGSNEHDPSFFGGSTAEQPSEPTNTQYNPFTRFSAHPASEIDNSQHQPNYRFTDDQQPSESEVPISQYDSYPRFGSEEPSELEETTQYGEVNTTSETPDAEAVGNGKFALIITNNSTTWETALEACKSLSLPSDATDASLFIAKNPEDSAWLVAKLNSFDQSSHFWVGLRTDPTYGGVKWEDGSSLVYSPLLRLTRSRDPSKVYAKATPDYGAIQFEFLSAEEETNGYICQYQIPA